MLTYGPFIIIPAAHPLAPSAKVRKHCYETGDLVSYKHRINGRDLSLQARSCGRYRELEIRFVLGEDLPAQTADSAPTGGEVSLEVRFTRRPAVEPRGDADRDFAGRCLDIGRWAVGQPYPRIRELCAVMLSGYWMQSEIRAGLAILLASEIGYHERRAAREVARRVGEGLTSSAAARGAVAFARNVMASWGYEIAGCSDSDPPPLEKILERAERDPYVRGVRSRVNPLD